MRKETSIALAAVAIVAFILLGIMIIPHIVESPKAKAMPMPTLGPTPQPSLPVTVVSLAGSQGPTAIRAEVASTYEEQMTGLMYRTALPADAGMLFVFDGDGPRAFWMEDTLIPLDMIFIAADGTIVNIYENATPLSTDIIRSTAPCRYVLEVNGGACRRLGVAAGSRVSLNITG